MPSSPADVVALAARLLPGRGEIGCVRLDEGLVNASYRLERGGELYVLRLRAAAASALGGDHFWEARILKLAERAGLAPRILCCDPSEGVLLTCWAAGRSFADPCDAGAIAAMAATIRAIHALPIPETPRMMQPRAWRELYRAPLTGADIGAPETAAAADVPPAALVNPDLLARLDAAADERLQYLESVAAQPAVLCHSDLHRGNILVSGSRTILLDWEYAHVGDGWWDLASWSCNNDFTADHGRALLENYLGRAAGSADVARFTAVAWLFDYICLLWTLRYAALRPEAVHLVSERARGLSEWLAGGRLERIPAH